MSEDLAVGITGKIDAGKDTAALILKEIGFNTYSMAIPLKEICLILRFEREEVYGTQEQKRKINNLWSVSGRKALQTLGTDIFRNILPKFIPSMEKIWVKLFYEKCKKGRFVIPDVRFLDEEEAVRALNGIIVRVVRTNDLDIFKREETKEEKYKRERRERGEETEEEKQQREEKERELAHSSEIELEKIKSDFTLNNYFLTKEEAKKYLIESISSRDFKVLYISNEKDIYQCCPYSGKVSLSGTCQEGNCDCKKFKVTKLPPVYKFRDTEFYDENGIYSLFFIPFSHFEEKTVTVFAKHPMSNSIRNEKLSLSLKYAD